MESHPARVNPRYHITAFLTGAAVMIGEIAAARAIAPHFGTSTIVWTNVIGIILVALSVGYWIGGKLSERHPDERFLGVIIALAGFLLVIPAFATPWIAGTLIGDLFRFDSGFLVVLIGSFAAVILLFALPIFLLGMVSPFLVKLACEGATPSRSPSTAVEGEKSQKGFSPSRGDWEGELVGVGSIAGKLYATSTIGSLVGTFLPTLVLLPAIGTRQTMLIAAAVLIVLGSALAIQRRVATVVGVLVLALMLISDHPQPWFLGGTVVAAAESSYQYLRIVDHNGDRLLVFNEGLGVQSVAVDAEHIPDGYFSAIATLPAFIAHDPVRVLILGNAGGTIGNLMQRFFPNRDIDVTGVELDPAVTVLTTAHFPPPPRPYPVIHADSRSFVRQSDERYDIIVVDAYTNQLTIPPHLVTKEFYELLREHLEPDGIVVANVNAPSGDSPLLRTIAQTIADVFPHVVEGSASAWNHLLIAAVEPIDPHVKGDVRIFLESMRPVSRDRAARIFTDDWAPIELMTDVEIFEALRNRSSS